MLKCGEVLPETQVHGIRNHGTSSGATALVLKHLCRDAPVAQLVEQRTFVGIKATIGCH